MRKGLSNTLLVWVFSSTLFIGHSYGANYSLSCQNQFHPLWSLDFTQDVISIKSVPVKHVHIVEVENKGMFVIRTSKTQSLDRELFNANFIKRFSGIRTSFVRELSSDEIEALTRVLPEKIVAHATVSEFHQGVTGQRYLADIGFNNVILRLLFLSNSNLDHSQTLLAQTIRSQLEDWKNINPELQSRVLSSINETDSWEELFGVLLNSNSESRGPLRKMVLREFLRELPENVLIQIIQLWAVYTTLGIPDFHPLNWIIHEDEVTGIDMVLQTQKFGDTLPIPFNFQYPQNPFSVYGQFPVELYEIFIENIPSKLKTQLRSVTSESVERLAQDLDLEINESYPDQVEQRARHLGSQ